MMHSKLVYPDGSEILFAAYCHDAQISPFQAAEFARDYSGCFAAGFSVHVVDGDATYRYEIDPRTEFAGELRAIADV